jgi:ADP-heptose:LPS heptosyltransferase
MKRFSSYLCIFHPGSLGDGLLALKAVHVLKKQFPDHLVVWFGHKELGEVLESSQKVHR